MTRHTAVLPWPAFPHTYHIPHCLQILANDRLPKPNATLPACPATLSNVNTGVDGVEPELTLQTKLGATRNFTCYAEKPSTYSEYLAPLKDVEELWRGTLFYDAAGFPTFELTFMDPYEDFIESTRTIVAFKEYFEIQNPGAAPSARYKVMSDTGSSWSPSFTYIERTDVVGGATPDSCSGSFANKEYSATYKFYMCQDGAAVAPVPAPVVPSPPVVVASPPPSPVVAPLPSPAVVAVPPPSPEASPAPLSPSPSPIVVTTSPSPSTPASGAATVALSAVGAALAAVAAVVLA